MADIRLMYDRKYFNHLDLNGRERTMRIKEITAGEVVGTGGIKSKKPRIVFHGEPKPFLICKTDSKTLIALFGSRDTAAMIGQWITVHPTTTDFGKDKGVDCVRIRNRKPTQAQIDGAFCLASTLALVAEVPTVEGLKELRESIAAQKPGKEHHAALAAATKAAEARIAAMTAATMPADAAPTTDAAQPAEAAAS